MATNGPNVYSRVLDVLPDGSTLFGPPCEASELRHSHKFNLEVEIGFGEHSLVIIFAVVKVALNMIMPPRDKIETLFREFIATIGPELTHNSEQLTCFGCARPATDFTWVSLYDPKGVVRRCRIFVKAGCEKCINHIQESIVQHLERQREKITSSSSILPVVIASIPRPDGMSSGPSAACLACRKEQTAAPGFSMSQCGKCKLVRYCSATCQMQDWVRHKKICTKIQTVIRTRNDF
ncbi:hypothetical protein C8F04DRAFT_1106908 [Mycena alexandri]|uniref:MYND-type domain-containing protein n=1 Tax=Mycena alexandri TaxID=1745969 RepID=A0AAD6X130_9AGAR|nr:hypothetical protein C8F04DRAFT_1106908 [Mycena alexandri]